nr:putative F-box domain-containing protein [Tanacetum cinerariifolium]
MSDLTFNLVDDILLRLDGEDLIRCKSVYDYKVVMWVGLDNDAVTLFRVLTLKSNIWKVIRQVKYKLSNPLGILWNGTLHWFMKDCKSMKKVIISFDLSREEFKEIPQPDDSRYVGNTPTKIDSLKKSLDDKFTIEDLGLDIYFLAKPNPSHLPTNLKLSLDKGVPISDLAAIHPLKYLKGTASKGLFDPIQPHLQVTGFTDADWAFCLMTRKSLTASRSSSHSIVVPSLATNFVKKSEDDQEIRS